MATRAMRVAIDATSLLDARTGVGNFTAALLAGLAARNDVQVTAFPVTLRGRRRLADEVPDGIRAVTPRLPAGAMRTLWTRFDRPGIDRLLGRPDVVHGPNFVVPPSSAGRLVTVHDLTVLRYPELCHPATLAYPALIRRAVDGGAWVHTVSHAVRTEAIDVLGLDPDRVVAVPNGFTPRGGGDPARGRRLAETDDFVLAVGTVEPRKDLITLVRAIDALATDGTIVPLVHAGDDGWGADALDAAVARMAHPELVTRLGRVDDEGLCDLYCAARLLAYPSRYEGFGLPVLEAMSAGTPVVSTDIEAVAEVAGDAALLVPTGDTDALAHAIESIWTDPDLADDLRTRGRTRAAQFSWGEFVDGMVDLYRAVCEDNGPPAGAGRVRGQR